MQAHYVRVINAREDVALRERVPQRAGAARRRPGRRTRRLRRRRLRDSVSRVSLNRCGGGLPLCLLRGQRALIYLLIPQQNRVLAHHLYHSQIASSPRELHHRQRVRFGAFAMRRLHTLTFKA